MRLPGHLFYFMGLIPLLVCCLWPGFYYSFTSGWSITLIPGWSIYSWGGIFGLGCYGLIYWGLQKFAKKVNPSLVLAHTLLTYIPLYYVFSEQYLMGYFGFEYVLWLDALELVCDGMFFLGQLLFVGNILGAIVKKR